MFGKDVVVDIVNNWDLSGRITHTLINATSKKIYNLDDCVIASGPMLFLQQIGALSRYSGYPPLYLSEKLFESIRNDCLEPVPISDVIKGTARIRLLGIHKKGKISVWHQFFPKVSLLSDQINVINSIGDFVYNFCSHLWFLAKPEEKDKLEYWLLWAIKINNNSETFFNNWLTKNNLLPAVFDPLYYLSLHSKHFSPWFSDITRKLSMSLYGMWQETVVGQSEIEKIQKEILDNKERIESHDT